MSVHACFSLILSASLCIRCSLVMPLFPSCSLAALLLPLAALAAFSRARSRWLPRVMVWSCLRTKGFNILYRRRQLHSRFYLCLAIFSVVGFQACEANTLLTTDGAAVLHDVNDTFRSFGRCQQGYFINDQFAEGNNRNTEFVVFL